MTQQPPGDGARSAAQTTVAATPDTEAGSMVGVAAWLRPDLVIHGQAGVVTTTPAHHVVSAGNTASFVSHQDINWMAQGHVRVAVRAGIELFTQGTPAPADKPVSETGIQLHAATGRVEVRASSNQITLRAAQAVMLRSTRASLHVGAPVHVQLSGGGSSLRISDGNITLRTRGLVSFKATTKVLTGPESTPSMDNTLSHGVWDECEGASDGRSQA